jgi:hypothetical protein
MAVAVTNEHLQVDWQLSKECVRDRIQTLLKTSQWSDCTFQVGGRTDFEVRLQDCLLKLMQLNETQDFKIEILSFNTYKFHGAEFDYLFSRLLFELCAFSKCFVFDYN